MPKGRRYPRLGLGPSASRIDGSTSAFAGVRYPVVKRATVALIAHFLGPLHQTRLVPNRTRNLPSSA